MILGIVRRYRCETCGERFNSKYNLELHEEVRDCEPTETTSNESDNGREQRTLRNGRVYDVEGAVCTYDEDGGYGFLTTADLDGEIIEDTGGTHDIFFHISEAQTDWVEEGDRLRCDVIEGDRGLECTNIEIIVRDSQRESYDTPADRAKRSGFGVQKDDGQYGAGSKSSPTESNIEDFEDERKFR